jgi:rhizosphere induced protein
MSNYTVNFVNDPSTGQTWTMAIYQTIPNMGAFENVIWRLATVPSGGQQSVRWAMSYAVVLASVDSGGDSIVYSPFQLLPSDTGQAWQVVNRNGVTQLVLVGQTYGSISITNATERNANAGIGIYENGSIYQRDLQPNARAEFDTGLRYWASLYKDVQVGQAISTAIAATSPVEVVFPYDATSVTLTASVKDGNLSFGKTGFP